MINIEYLEKVAKGVDKNEINWHLQQYRQNKADTMWNNIRSNKHKYTSNQLQDLDASYENIIATSSDFGYPKDSSILYNNTDFTTDINAYIQQRGKQAFLGANLISPTTANDLELYNIYKKYDSDTKDIDMHKAWNTWR